MDERSASVDHSIWRYYRDGGKGFAGRYAERQRSAPRTERNAEKETLARASGKAKRKESADSTLLRSLRRGKSRSTDDIALDRARQTLLGLVLKGSADGQQPSIPIDEAMVKAQVETMSSETLQKMTAFFSTVQAGDSAVSPSASAPVMKSLDAELAKRGISLQLSGKVNNVYLSGENANWAVNASAGGDPESEKRSNNDRAAARGKRYNNFGQTLGRAAKNFLLGH